ncbi:MAG: hypothetical protein ACR2IV_01460 [Bryobacteraceae bacterium]
MFVTGSLVKREHFFGICDEGATERHTRFAKRTHGMSLADLRENYGLGELNEQNCETNPIVQFERWIKDAEHSTLNLGDSSNDAKLTLF